MKANKEDHVKEVSEALDHLSDMIDYPRQNLYSIVQMRTVDLEHLSLILTEVIRRYDNTEGTT